MLFCLLSLLRPTMADFTLQSMGISNETIHCPDYNDAVSSCPQETAIFYFSCCGDQNMYCCKHIQTWIIVSCGVFVGLILLISFAAAMKCICSYRRRTKQSYSFGNTL
ncbi:hypothetical protein WR25_20372 [Diploscapter pachys]|uniref:Uncharacterized protein n=1 Tax=Diploscapter pachys TaxID=2018661 RepID=A0A2A2KUS1_9BILA|nr:hypothetical protein WR25_20372 [Diploscapter pachys]